MLCRKEMRVRTKKVRMQGIINYLPCLCSHLHEVVHLCPVLIGPLPALVSLQLLTERRAQVADTAGKRVKR